MVQCLRRWPSNEGGTGSISGLETKIPHARQCSQKKKKYVLSNYFTALHNDLYALEVISVWWKWWAVCSNSVVKLEAWNWPWQENLHHGYWQMLQIRVWCIVQPSSNPEAGQPFSIKGQRVNIFGFASHMASVAYIQGCALICTQVGMAWVPTKLYKNRQPARVCHPQYNSR